MKKTVLLSATYVLIGFMVISCGPSGRVGLDESRLCIPRDLQIDSVGNRYAKIAWDPGCPGTRIMRGFDIYLSPVPLVDKYSGREFSNSIKPHNHELYPGDAEGNPDRETYEIENISNATRYFVHVRAVYNDGSFSKPSNEIDLICYPQGILELAVSYSGDQAGFSFAEDRYCRTNNLENDIYFYHKDGKDFLCSPSRLGAVNRMTKIYPAGKGVTPPYPEKLQRVGEASEKIEILPGRNIVIETEDGYYAGLYIRQLERSGDDRRAIIQYFYRPPVAEPVP